MHLKQLSLILNKKAPKMRPKSPNQISKKLKKNLRENFQV